MKKSKSNFLTIAILPSLLMSLESKTTQNNEDDCMISEIEVWSKSGVPLNNQMLVTPMHLHAVIQLPKYSQFHVHRCGTSGSMRACHAAGPGSIPGRDRFPG